MVQTHFSRLPTVPSKRSASEIDIGGTPPDPRSIKTLKQAKQDYKKRGNRMTAEQRRRQQHEWEAYDRAEKQREKEKRALKEARKRKEKKEKEQAEIREKLKRGEPVGKIREGQMRITGWFAKGQAAKCNVDKTANGEVSVLQSESADHDDYTEDTNDDDNATEAEESGGDQDPKANLKLGIEIEIAEPTTIVHDDKLKEEEQEADQGVTNKQMDPDMLVECSPATIVTDNTSQHPKTPGCIVAIEKTNPERGIKVEVGMDPESKDNGNRSSRGLTTKITSKDPPKAELPIENMENAKNNVPPTLSKQASDLSDDFFDGLLSQDLHDLIQSQPESYHKDLKKLKTPMRKSPSTTPTRNNPHKKQHSSDVTQKNIPLCSEKIKNVPRIPEMPSGKVNSAGNTRSKQRLELHDDQSLPPSTQYPGFDFNFQELEELEMSAVESCKESRLKRNGNPEAGILSPRMKERSIRPKISSQFGGFHDENINPAKGIIHIACNKPSSMPQIPQKPYCRSPLQPRQVSAHTRSTILSTPCTANRLSNPARPALNNINTNTQSAPCTRGSTPVMFSSQDFELTAADLAELEG
ncbi:MAG: hypothetical protein M1834_005947 [Cirrosporium novae-zelandiae]|nr:MAG: hypothetical protein M1834_005947 [Cirrosporium novae-zelandiae]